MSKVAQKSVQEFSANILKDLLPEDTSRILTPRIVALRCLETLTRRLRSDGNTDTLMNDELISRLLAIINSSIAPSTPTSADAQNLEASLSILEAGSISSAPSQGSSWSTTTLTQRCALLSPLLNLPDAQGERIQTLALKLTLNLTNNNPKICDLFASPALVGRLVESIVGHFGVVTNGEVGEGEREIRRDNLLLSLGAMFNLAECSGKARRAVVSGGDGLVEALVKCFGEGLERADQVSLFFLNL